MKLDYTGQFNLMQVKQNTQDLKRVLEKLASQMGISTQADTLGPNVLAESSAMAERLAAMKLLAEAGELEALKELAIWSIVDKA